MCAPCAAAKWRERVSWWSHAKKEGLIHCSCMSKRVFKTAALADFQHRNEVNEAKGGAGKVGKRDRPEQHTGKREQDRIGKQ
eukprot:1157093-Pelagomonas_calceolata.AAC.3